ncbi:uncharacterized protein BJX67DRAFT_382339 [Aspergillus lucknowensis]|uniref:Uncharacterized protein n=1 Tax=Aspergillus lucknowensis TaxID=176173 RepID=A0ABR4LN55_9EURO
MSARRNSSYPCFRDLPQTPAGLRSLGYDYNPTDHRVLPFLEPRHLRAVWTDFSRNSLAKLADLAENPRLAPLVHSLHIERAEDKPLGEGFAWPRDKWGQLVQPQAVTNQLTSVIQGFSNCSSFKVSRTPGIVFSEASQDFPTPGEAVSLFNTILAATGHCVQEEYEIDFKSSEFIPYNGENPADKVSFDVTILDHPAFRFTWSNLQSLTLKFPIQSDNTIDFAVSLIKSSLNLRKLAIDFDDGDGAAELLTRVLAAKPTFQLEGLTLTNGTLVGQGLFRFLRTHDSNLKTLRLDSIHLTKDGSWVPIMAVLRREFPCLVEAYLVDVSDGSSTTGAFTVDMSRKSLSGKTLPQGITWNLS